jgi:hypothetical protein
MKLKLVHYDRGKLLECKQDDVWFIITRGEPCNANNPEMFTYWDEKRRLPCETACPSLACYSSYYAALADFSIIEHYYKNKGGFQTLKEVTI